jgi:hypothetical protein
MTRKTKADLEARISELEEALNNELSRPTGHKIDNCNIDMSAPDSTKIAIAEAVGEGMKALQQLGVKSEQYGMYFAGNMK